MCKKVCILFIGRLICQVQGRCCSAVERVIIDYLSFTDNVTLTIDGVLYLKIFDPYKVMIRTNKYSFVLNNVQLENIIPILNGCAQMLYCHLFHCQASYGVDDVQYAVKQLAQTSMRSELGKISLDTIFQERESLNIAIVGKYM